MINRNQNEEFKSKENCCSSVSTYLIKNYPDIPLQKFDSYATAKEAFENGTSVAWANDSHQRNDTLLDWINEEIKTLGEEQFFHADYEETLKDTYGSEYEDSLVVEGGETK